MTEPSNAVGARRGQNVVQEWKRRRMSNFREVIDVQAEPTRIPSWANPGVLKEVDFIQATNEKNAGQVIMTCGRLISDLDGSEDSIQLCSYFLTLISSVFRDTEVAAIGALRQLGATPTMRQLPRDSGITAIELEADADSGLCILVVAQAVLVLFKNISTQGYDNFIRNRVNAIRAILGVDPELAELRAFSYERAHMFHARIGACVDLKVKLINSILVEARNNHHLGKVCTYLTTILAWTDMSALTFIADALLTTKSPVLLDERVFTEVRAVAEAFAVVNSFKYPQFFKIMKSPLEGKVVERNKFPILFSVACRIRALTHPSLRNFVVPAADNDVVVELVNLHNSSRRTVPVAINNVVRFITDFADDNYAPLIEEVENVPAIDQQ